MSDQPAPLGALMPEGTAFIGESPAAPGWTGPDFPSNEDLSSCVACGLCLPHCPTYRLTGEESASPRGRIAAMRAVSEGSAVVDETFGGFMDLCLACRACEDVCPSHVPFGRMMERARVQVEPLRTRRARFVRWLGLDVLLSHRWMLSIATSLTPIVKPVLPRTVRALVPHGRRGRRVPSITAAKGEERGVVALLTGCVQDQWFREVNRSSVRVLSREGWRVIVPRGQACCGALAAHNGRLGTARKLARRNARAFAGVDVVLVNAAGCSAHMKEYGELVAEAALPVLDLMEFIAAEGLREVPAAQARRVAYHDACHALRAQHIEEQPRDLLRQAGLQVVDIPGGDTCCGAAGLYNITEPEMSGKLRRAKAEAIASLAVTTIASANPGCTMQIAAGLRELGVEAEVLHPVQLLDRASAPGGLATTRT